MKYYYLGLATLVVVICGCVVDGGQVFPRKDQYYAPPAARLQRPGPMVDGPGPAVMAMMASGGGGGYPGAVPMMKTTQVAFVNPVGMHIGWKIDQGYAENQLVTPGRYEFVQGQTYRLKLTNIPNREGTVLYPTIEVYPAHPQTDAYLSHSSVPVEITDDDLDQVESNNVVTKVIYLPDARHQGAAIAGVATLVSSVLPPGADPVAEADRNGTIMLVIRMGNVDMEMPTRQEEATAMMGGDVSQVAWKQVDGEQGQHQPPVPVGAAGSDNGLRIPGPMIVGSGGRPGMPAANMVAGMGGLPSWGMPMTGTPIGLVGPPHLPLGGPASLRSHTMINRTPMEIPRPVKDFRIKVSHKPGYRLPDPVNEIEYTEKHPDLAPGEVSYPAWSGGPGAGGAFPGGNCPPGMGAANGNPPWAN